jgi:hypothetical protein
MNRQLDPQRDAKPGKVTHAEAQSTTIPSGRMYQMARPAPEASWRVIRQRETTPKRGGLIQRTRATSVIAGTVYFR